MQLVLLCILHSVRVEFLLMFIQCPLLRRFCDLGNHTVWMQTPSSFLWACRYVRLTLGQSWFLLSSLTLCARYFQVQPSYEAPFPSAYLPSLVVCGTYLHCRFESDISIRLYGKFWCICTQRSTHGLTKYNGFLGEARHQYSEWEVCADPMFTWHG